MRRGNDDETETSSKVTTDPALDATAPADPTLPQTGPHGDVTDDSAPVTRIGRYRVIDELGSGGMGVVYRAKDPDLDRELAIKVVRPQSGTPRAQERLLSEARAMARLRHPAVVPVFDIGATSRGVFIVMPLVAGGTLYDWMKDVRPWREVVVRFLTAARGLAAAHAAGLVHRDFKPRNVLLGDGGQVMVADFGIATRTDDSLAPDGGVSTPGTAQVSSIAGTPAYMSPEQADGRPIDARADQYSFCISMWEALCGERPHQAETRTQSGVPLGDLAPRGGRRGAPAWLLAAVERGFAAAPEQRWPTMDALIEHVEGRMRRPRRIAAAAAIASVALVGAAIVVLGSGRQEDPCPDPRGRLASIWTPAVRAQIERVFAETKLPFVDDTLSRVVPALDAYANGWRTKIIAACRAGRVERTQSEALLARRNGCLDRRLAALGARTQAFRAGGASVIEGAIASVETLPALDECENTEALLAYTTTVAPAAHARIDQLERELDEIAATDVLGQLGAQTKRLESIVTRTRSEGHPPIHARALELHAMALERSGAPREAVLRELVQTASEARNDAAVVRAWVALITVLVEQAKLDEVKALEPVAEAALIRAGSPPALRFQLHAALAERALKSGELDAAIARWKDALAAATHVAERARIQSAMAAALAASGRNAEALPLATEALRETEDARGAQHPEAVARRRFLASLQDAH